MIRTIKIKSKDLQLSPVSFLEITLLMAKEKERTLITLTVGMSPALIHFIIANKSHYHACFHTPIGLKVISATSQDYERLLCLFEEIHSSKRA